MRVSQDGFATAYQVPSPHSLMMENGAADVMRPASKLWLQLPGRSSKDSWKETPDDDH